MDMMLTALIAVAALVGAGQGTQIFLARHIEKLVLEGSRFHLAQGTNGAVELRSGVRPDALTQREAGALAPALRVLTSRIRRSPFLGLKLLSKNHRLVEAKSIEDSFQKAAVESQRQELILIAEDRGVRGRTVPLIMAVERDEDFAKLRAAINATDFGDDISEGVSKGLQLKDRQAIEPLVLWSSKSLPAGAFRAKAIEPLPQKIDTGKAGVSEETVPSLPGHTIRTWLSGRNGPYESIVVELREGSKSLFQKSVYTDIYRGRLDSQVEKVKGELVQQVKTLNAMGI